MRVAIADPPYIGQAAKHYRDHPDYAGEVDHAELLWRLDREYDSWALCMSAPSVQQILAFAPPLGPSLRLGVWTKTFAAFKKNVNPAYCFEPVLFRLHRPRTKEQPTIRDWLACPITLKKGISGAKPKQFSFWLFDFLNLEPADDLDDLYPGSGAIGRAWEEWRSSLLWEAA